MNETTTLTADQMSVLQEVVDRGGKAYVAFGQPFTLAEELEAMGLLTFGETSGYYIGSKPMTNLFRITDAGREALVRDVPISETTREYNIGIRS